MASWPFRRARATVTVTSGSQSVTGLPSDYGQSMALIRNDGVRLQPLTADIFLDRYYATVNALTGDPVAYTNIDAEILVGPTPTATSSAYELLYTKSLTELSADADLPDIPTEYHPILVAGATATGLRRENDPTWEALEQEWKEGVAQMRSAYGRPSRDDGGGSFEYPGYFYRQYARDVDDGS